MSSKKKKSYTTRCDFCNNYFLTVDIEKHSGILLSPQSNKTSPINTLNDLPLKKCLQNSENMQNILCEWDDTKSIN